MSKLEDRQGRMWGVALGLATWILARAAASAPPLVEVVPVYRHGATAPAPWMQGFVPFAERYWRVVAGEAPLRLRRGRPIAWEACDTCRLREEDPRSLRPWLDQLWEATDRADAYLLLLPAGGLDRPGLRLPEVWLRTTLGLTGAEVLLATSPQAALHELGHFLGLPDRYAPHEGYAAPTLMGLVWGPVTPPDPALRGERGWARVRHWRLTPGTARTTAIVPETVLALELPDGSTAWVGLAPLLAADGTAGWLFEVDLVGAANRFRRLAEGLYGIEEPGTGRVMLRTSAATWRLDWSFVPIAPRAWITLTPVSTPALSFPTSLIDDILETAEP